MLTIVTALSHESVNSCRHQDDELHLEHSSA